jgi:hypothetical protein
VEERVLKIRTEICFGTREECLPQTWSLFKTLEGGYFIRHWKTRDGKRRSRKIPLEARRIEPILEKLMQLNVPIAPEPVLGCDGDFTELHLGEDYAGGAHFRWWSVPPEGWEELDALTQQILDMADKPESGRGAAFYLGGH